MIMKALTKISNGFLSLVAVALWLWQVELTKAKCLL